jgi:hypothetical protein
MKKHWCLLAMGLTACGQQVEIAPGVALTQQYRAAFQQQVQVLQAERVRVAATPATGTGPAQVGILTLEVLNPQVTAEQHPDTLKQRMRKLAHLLVVGLASPASYQAVSAQALFKRSIRSPRATAGSQAFIYPLASLK